MSRTLTIRLPGPMLRQVQARARSLGLTPSELVRRMLTESAGAEAGEPTAFELTRNWVGVVASRKVANGRDARAALGDWDPDRRG
jgi:antitoxin component of RelBE/YafQ-DinJ toxin-antitoxin module